MTATSRVRTLNQTRAQVMLDPATASFKRIAWAYGCAPKGSDEEAALREILIARAQVESQADDEQVVVAAARARPDDGGA